MTKQIPNIFTLLNLLFGCLAIVAVLQNGIVLQYGEDGATLITVSERMWMASIFIGIAAVIDFLDGFVARLLGASSELGKQLDSLSDVVSFGVAPSMIMYQFLRLAVAQDEDGLNASIAWLLPAFLIALAGAYRLARFNLDDSQAYGFKGVPIPAAGLVVASLPLIYWYATDQRTLDILRNKWFLYGVILALSYLMVSKLPLLAFKFKSTSVKDNLPLLILAVLAVVLGLLFKWAAVPLVFVAYIIISLAFKTKQA